MNMTPKVKRKVKQIPGEQGWWNSSGEDAFLKLAEQMLALGLEEDTVIDFLETAYWATANEFGL